jgi:hypothetical protein
LGVLVGVEGGSASAFFLWRTSDIADGGGEEVGGVKLGIEKVSCAGEQRGEVEDRCDVRGGVFSLAGGRGSSLALWRS